MLRGWDNNGVQRWNVGKQRSGDITAAATERAAYSVWNCAGGAGVTHAAWPPGGNKQGDVSAASINVAATLGGIDLGIKHRWRNAANIIGLGS